MPSGQPYPGPWIFAYPVVMPAQASKAQQALLTAASPVASAPPPASSALAVSTPPVAPAPPVAATPAVGTFGQTDSDEPKPKFYPLKPVLTAQSAQAVIQAVEETPAATQVVEAETQAEADLQAEAPIFEISSALISEPQTNSIVIAQPEDPLAGDIFTDSGHFVRTGSIEIVPVRTGEIAVVSETAEADGADSMDSITAFVPGIAPVAANTVANSRASVSMLQPSRRRAKDTTSTSLVLLISISVVAALAAIAYFFGFFG